MEERVLIMGLCRLKIRSFIVRNEYLPLSLTGYDEDKIPLASVGPQDKKAVCAANGVFLFLIES